MFMTLMSLIRPVAVLVNRVFLRVGTTHTRFYFQFTILSRSKISYPSPRDFLISFTYTIAYYSRVLVSPSVSFDSTSILNHKMFHLDYHSSTNSAISNLHFTQTEILFRSFQARFRVSYQFH